MRRRMIIAALWIVALFLLACAGMALPLDFAIALGFGWVWYLARVLPQVGVAWGGVITAALCLALFLAGLHTFLVWLYDQVGAAADPGDPAVRRWRPRWTLALGVLLVLIFVAGLSAAGIAHQVGWLLTSEEPLVQSDSGAMSRAISTNNLRQIGLGLDGYHEAHQSFPPAGRFDVVGRPLHGWQAILLPFIERKDFHDRIDFGIPWDHPRNAPAFRTELPVYRIPAIRERSDGAGYALSHYAGNAHVLGGDIPRSLAEVTDGTATTIIAGEVAGDFKPWGYPVNWRDPALGINRSPEGFGGPSPGGANFLFMDGSVHFLKNHIDPQVLKSLGTPAGGEPVSSDSY
jgi:prepilin-type processing-associated H-X9-DG protein